MAFSVTVVDRVDVKRVVVGCQERSWTPVAVVQQQLEEVEVGREAGRWVSRRMCRFLITGRVGVVNGNVMLRVLSRRQWLACFIDKDRW